MRFLIFLLVSIICVFEVLEGKKKKKDGKKTAAKKAKAVAAANQRAAAVLSEAKAYMESQEPIKMSGGRPISELIADAEEAKQVVPYNHHKMMAARLNALNKDNGSCGHCECEGTSDAGKSSCTTAKVSMALVMLALATIIII